MLSKKPAGPVRRWWIAATVGLLAAAPAHADELKVGLSGALTGPAAALGLGMKSGIEAYFARVNAAGGVHGRTLKLIALDDGYEPARAGSNMHKLIDEEKVFAVLGNPGTPTAAVSVPIANAKHIPFFGAFTGAGLLRKTPPMIGIPTRLKWSITASSSAVSPLCEMRIAASPFAAMPRWSATSSRPSFRSGWASPGSRSTSAG